MNSFQLQHSPRHHHHLHPLARHYTRSRTFHNGYHQSLIMLRKRAKYSCRLRICSLSATFVSHNCWFSRVNDSHNFAASRSIFTFGARSLSLMLGICFFNSSKRFFKPIRR
uniref:Uncharacterized protein n=1 Tax=Ceratitis capitata TaxID=7213 RepID=W8BDZ2_CERCA